MPFTLSSNHNNNGFLEQAHHLIEKIELRPECSYLFLSLFGSINDYLSSLVDHLNERKYDFVCVLFPFESPDWYKCIKPLYEFTTRIAKTKFSVIDCGHPLQHCDHFVYNTFINENHESWTPISANQRSNYFVCANRILKSHRIRLLNNLYLLLTPAKVLTAGNFSIRQNNLNDVYFPVPLAAADEPQMLDPGFNSQRIMPNSFKKSIFNLVTESSYENIGDTFETWSRIMVTEKSVKPFRLHQFPIFLAPKGHVAYLKQLGFDVFDDIVDHSYDECSDPLLRIKLVTDLVNNLVQHPIESYQNLIEKNWNRLEENRTKCDSIKKQLDFDLVNKFNFWTNSKID